MLLILLLQLIHTTVATSSLRVVEKLSEVPVQWTGTRPASHSQKLYLQLALKQQNVEQFEQLVLNLSTPSNAAYGQYVTQSEINAILRPSQSDAVKVVRWLRSYGATFLLDNDFIALNASVATLNRMLNASFAWYKNKDTDEEIIRTLEYSVPSDLVASIDFIQPTTIFVIPRPLADRTKLHPKLVKFSTSRASLGKRHTKPPSDHVCNQTITPSCLLKLYNVYYGANSTGGSELSFAAFTPENARYIDLAIFEKQQAPYAIGQNFSVITVHNGTNDQSKTPQSPEADLDNQYAVTIGYPLPVTEFSSGNFYQFLQPLLKLVNLPQVISVSYGESERAFPANYARRLCNGMAQLGARGVSVICASGDAGPGSDCIPNPRNRSLVEFDPFFPQSCPFVTAVGGTTMIPQEEAWVASGGGFSNYFVSKYSYYSPQPSYQATQVANYLSTIPKSYKTYYNRSGRGYPDVASHATNFVIQVSGQTAGLSGTSGSAPTFAGIVALLNAARLAQGNPVLGFLNPWLYENGYKGLNDIILGESVGCYKQLPGHQSASWKAAKGWDAVTGFGTPDFAKLLQLVAPGTCNDGGPLKNPKSNCE